MLIQISKKEEQIAGVEMLGLIRKNTDISFLKMKEREIMRVWFQADWQMLQ